MTVLRRRSATKLIFLLSRRPPKSPKKDKWKTRDCYSLILLQILQLFRNVFGVGILQLKRARTRSCASSRSNPEINFSNA